MTTIHLDRRLRAIAQLERARKSCERRAEQLKVALTRDPAYPRWLYDRVRRVWFTEGEVYGSRAARRDYRAFSRGFAAALRSVRADGQPDLAQVLMKVMDWAADYDAPAAVSCELYEATDAARRARLPIPAADDEEAP